MEPQLELIGLDHRLATVAVRERLAMDRAAAGQLLALGRASGVWKEALILSTCNRTEVYAFVENAAGFEAFLHNAFAERGVLMGPLADSLRRASGQAAARHFIRVTCGLESRILGEVEILGQVKEALTVSRHAGTHGPRVERFVVTALQAGRRARSETAIAKGALSVASAAVTLATRNGGGLKGMRALVIGAGETGRLLALHIADKKPAELLITNRTMSAAEKVAAEASGRAVPLSAIPSAILAADVAMVAVRSSAPLLTTTVLSVIMAARAYRPLLVVDVSVPRAVEPGVAKVPGVTVVSIDDVGEMVARNKERREAEVRKVEDIVEQECARFLAASRLAAEGVPVVRELRAHFEKVREAEVARYLDRFPVSDRDAVERLTRSMVNKLLHGPMSRLRESDPASERGLSRLTAARDLFDLSGAPEGQGRGR